MKSGFARAKVSCLKNLDVWSARIDAKKITNDTLKDTEENVYTEANRGLQRLTEAYRHIWSLGLFELNLISLAPSP